MKNEGIMTNSPYIAYYVFYIQKTLSFHCFDEMPHDKSNRRLTKLLYLTYDNV